MLTDLSAQYRPFLETVLTPARLEHSLNVMQMMQALTPIYHLDAAHALSAGLLHDAAKDLTAEQYQPIVDQAQIPIRHPSELDYTLYLHGPVGACFVAQRLGIRDSIILDAIRMHTYYGEGQAFDSPLLWCLRFSDMLEPARDWSRSRWLRDGAARLRELVFAGEMRRAAFLQTGWLVRWFDETGRAVLPNMRRVYRDLSLELGLGDDYLMAHMQ